MTKAEGSRFKGAISLLCWHKRNGNFQSRYRYQFKTWSTHQYLIHDSASNSETETARKLDLLNQWVNSLFCIRLQICKSGDRNKGFYKTSKKKTPGNILEVKKFSLRKNITIVRFYIFRWATCQNCNWLATVWLPTIATVCI